MPTSNFWNITKIIGKIEQLKPKSVLDIGCGNGKYGFLIKEYWPETKVDGLDIFPKYFKKHHSVYDNLFERNALEVDYDEYDLYLIIDVLEHWPMDKAHALLKDLTKKGNVLFSTPLSMGVQGAEHGNEWERHTTQWLWDDFKDYSVDWIEDPYTIMGVCRKS
jgi:SAM-dependent methyltransferase